jgi:hypothetical protein
MGFESGEGGVIPTGYESERVAGFDHDAKHGDRDERPAITDPGAAPGVFGLHHGGGAAISGTGERLCAPALPATCANAISVTAGCGSRLAP